LNPNIATIESSHNSTMPAVLSTLIKFGDFTIRSQSVSWDHDYKDLSLWETVPRGCNYISVDDTKIATLMGVRKFGYENDKFGPPVPPEDLKTVVLMEKANGENAKMSAFTHGGRHFWLVSAKNVCIVYEVGNLDETLAKISSMEKPDRYNTVIKIAKIWESIMPVLALHAELAAKKWTLNAEIILDDTDHIVIYTKKNCFKFFAITHDAPSSTGLTAVSPMEAITFFEAYSLDHVECHGPYAYGSSEHLAKLDEITFATDSNGRVLSEGVVSYAMSADERVRLILKHKSILYDLERSGIRHCQQNGELTESDLRSRIEMLAGSDINRPVVQRWLKTRFPFFLAFTEWLQSETILPLPPKGEKDAWIERLTCLIPTSSASASSTSGEGPSWMFQARWLKLQKIFEPIYATLPAIREEAYDLFKTATYVAVRIKLPCLPVLTASLPKPVEAFIATKAQREFHITTLFCHKDPSLDQLRLADQLIDHIGKSFSFRITHLLYTVKNDKVILVTLVVERADHALPAENQHLHITIACGSGVKPAASNQMAALHVSEKKEALLADNQYGLFRDASIHAITFPYKIFVSGALTPVARAPPAVSNSSTSSSTNSSTSSASNSASNSSSSSRASKPKKPYKVIVFRGPSGSGKSTAANELKTFLESLGMTVVLLETDTCSDILAAMNGLKKDPPQVILITGVSDKKFSSVDRDLEVWFTHSSGYGLKDHIEFLVKRVNMRGEDHPSFTPKKLEGKTNVRAGITSQVTSHHPPAGAFTVDETVDPLSVIKMELEKRGLLL